jgi:Ankyrin repeats (3 copies)
MFAGGAASMSSDEDSFIEAIVDTDIAKLKRNLNAKVWRVGAVDRQFMNPLFAAAMSFSDRDRSEEVFDLLLAHGGNIRVVDHRGWSLLHFACAEGNIESLVYLSGTHDLPLDVRDDNGNTPLHAACIRGQLDLAMTLISMGASIHVINNDGMKPTDLFGSLPEVGCPPDFMFASRPDNIKAVKWLQRQYAHISGGGSPFVDVREIPAAASSPAKAKSAAPKQVKIIMLYTSLLYRLAPFLHVLKLKCGSYTYSLLTNKIDARIHYGSAGGALGHSQGQ